jgi:hypothetical protein
MDHLVPGIGLARHSNLIWGSSFLMQPIPPLPPLSQLIQQAQSLTGTPALYAVGLGAVIVVAARDWRLVLAGFTAITLGSALLASTLLPPEWALVRVIVGGLVAIMWYLSAQRAGWGGYFLPFQRQGGVWARPLSSTTLFRTLLALALAGGLLATRPRLPLPTLPTDIQAVVIWLGAFALLGLALGDEALQAGAALLMWLAATQLLFAALRQEAWLIWLLSSVELLVGLATAYLMVARGSAVRKPPEGTGS